MNSYTYHQMRESDGHVTGNSLGSSSRRDSKTSVANTDRSNFGVSASVGISNNSDLAPPLQDSPVYLGRASNVVTRTYAGTSIPNGIGSERSNSRKFGDALDIAGTTIASSRYEVDYDDDHSFVSDSAGKDEENITCGR